jgi:hypothetical protein
MYHAHLLLIFGVLFLPYEIIPIIPIIITVITNNKRLVMVMMTTSDDGAEDNEVNNK